MNLSMHMCFQSYLIVSISGLYCYVTNYYHNIVVFKQPPPFIISHNSVGKDSIVGGWVSRSSMRLQLDIEQGCNYQSTWLGLGVHFQWGSFKCNLENWSWLLDGNHTQFLSIWASPQGYMNIFMAWKPSWLSPEKVRDQGRNCNAI